MSWFKLSRSTKFFEETRWDNYAGWIDKYYKRGVAVEVSEVERKVAY